MRKSDIDQPEVNTPITAEANEPDLTRHFDRKQNKAHSTESVTVYTIALKSSLLRTPDPAHILRCMTEYKSRFRNWGTQSTIATTVANASRGEYNFFTPNKKLRQLFAQHATLEQQIDFIALMGLTAGNRRHPNYSQAVQHQEFSNSLAMLDIDNTNPTSTNRFNIIYAVHPSFLNDPEIRYGLSIPYKKKSPGENIAYVSCPQTLQLAFSMCRQNSTLIIDGHWTHEKSSTHGVWEHAPAEDIAQHLVELRKKHPGKVNYIRLLGCESGHLPAHTALPTDIHKSIQFKDSSTPNFHKLEMASFRNRAIVYGNEDNMPFAPSSLAGQILLQSQGDESLMLTAPPSLTYPYPLDATSSGAVYNIGSDNPEWRSEASWQKKAPSDAPAWYKKLSQLKSITFISGTPAFIMQAQWPKKSVRFFHLHQTSQARHDHKKKLIEGEESAPATPIRS